MMPTTTTRRNPLRQCRQHVAIGTSSARPTQGRSSSSSLSSSSEEAYFTPNSEGSSDVVATPPEPSPLRISTRRRLPLLPASLGSSDTSVPSMTPATGGVVRRMRWTLQLNESVMRAYYGATQGGTVLTAYRSRMLSLFQELNPTTTITAQRLSDQVRAIQRLNLLEQPVLDRLRLESLSAHPVVNQRSVTSQAVTASVRSITQEPAESTHIDEVFVTNQFSEKLRSALEDAILEFRDIPILARPRLPRLPTHTQNIVLVGALNNILKSYIHTCSTLSETHSLLYCGAIAACRVGGARFLNFHSSNRRTNTIPLWQCRIQKKIDSARTTIAKLYAFRMGNSRPRIMRYVVQAFAGTGISRCDYQAWITERIDFFKQKMYAWAKRIRRYKERSDRFIQNHLFQSDQKRIYRSWECPEQQFSGSSRPSRELVSFFWQNIWSVPATHTEGLWFNSVQRSCESISEMDPVIICDEDVSSAIHGAPNWKAPGPDGLQNFWLKKFNCLHSVLATQFQNILDLGSLPAFMTTGVTYLLFKSGSTSEPNNYRPITCLPTLYKLLTSILKFKIMRHVSNNNILASVQNGCKPRSRGTKELLLIDMTICQQVRRVRKNISMAWVDYKKAYDSVPHSWLLRVCTLYKLHPNLCSFLHSCMSSWATRLCYMDGMDFSDSPDLIQIKRGIFQGDSLSPLWFCLSLNPLSTLLRDSLLGYRLRRNGEIVSHLLYMDDVKLYAPNESDLVTLLKITQNFSNDIRMEFGLDKCAVIRVQRGQILNSSGVDISESVFLHSLSESENYKYLGMSQGLCIADKDMKELLTARFLGRAKKVFKSLLSGGNKARAFNSWAIPALSYSFGILKWTQTELDKLDRKVRRLMTSFRMHHPRSSVMRLYIPRKCGGRGYLNAKSLHNRQVCNLRDYFVRIDDNLHRDVVSVDNGFTPLSMAKQNWRRLQVLTTPDRLAVWQSKELHGRFYRAFTGPDVDQQASISWLRFGNLFAETEGFVCAIMDEVVMTNNYRRHIIKDGTVDICRACRCPGESIRHIVSGCSRLANGEYLHRHNQVAKIIHQQLALKYGLIDSEFPYYQYQPAPVLDNGLITLYWDRSIITDRTIVANRPDLVLIDRSVRKAMIVDITIPHDDNLIKAETEKLSKYLDLAHEITSMWGVDSTIIVPIVVSVNGLIAKSFNRYLEKLSLSCWIKHLAQKAVLLETARIVRRFLSADP